MMGDMSKVTVYIDQDEWWPWNHFSEKRYGNPLTIDRETAERWEAGLKAATALQDEIAEALGKAYPDGRPS